MAGLRGMVSAVLLAASIGASRALYTESGISEDRRLFGRIDGANSSQVALSRKRRFFAPLPAGATFILTPKFTMPIPGLSPGGSSLNVEIPLSFALPTEATSDGGSAKYKADGEADTYTYYRSLEQDKADMYTYAENFISQFGLDGKQCVLRTICEIAESPVEHAGMMGEIVNTVLKTTVEPGEGARLKEYRKAEERGKNVGQCEQYYSTCPVSVFKLM